MMYIRLLEVYWRAKWRLGDALDQGGQLVVLIEQRCMLPLTSNS